MATPTAWYEPLLNSESQIDTTTPLGMRTPGERGRKVRVPRIVAGPVQLPRRQIAMVSLWRGVAAVGPRPFGFMRR